MRLLRIALVCLAASFVTVPAYADTFTKGVIKKVNAKKKKVTIIHEECDIFVGKTVFLEPYSVVHTG